MDGSSGFTQTLFMLLAHLEIHINYNSSLKLLTRAITTTSDNMSIVSHFIFSKWISWHVCQKISIFPTCCDCQFPVRNWTVSQILNPRLTCCWNCVYFTFTPSGASLGRCQIQLTLTDTKSPRRKCASLNSSHSMTIHPAHILKFQIPSDNTKLNI